MVNQNSVDGCRRWRNQKGSGIFSQEWEQVIEADVKHLQARQLELLWLLEGQWSMMVDLFSQGVRGIG